MQLKALMHTLKEKKQNIHSFKLTPNIAFCIPNGIGVRRVNRTTLNALGPEITRSIARPVSFLINLKIEANIKTQFK